MGNRKIIVCLVIAAALHAGCSKSSRLDRTAYAKEVSGEGSGLVQTKTFGDYEVQLFYQPMEYLFLKENGGVTLESKKFEAWKKEQGDYDHFVLRIKNKKVNELSNAGAASMEAYAQKLDYLMNAFQDDIQMIAGGDTLPCALMHYERNFGLSPNNNFSLLFEGASNRADKERTVIVDLSILEIGILKFNYDSETIKNQPQLIFDL
jgi:hypothetical protein